MKRILILFACILGLTACKGTKSLLPNVSGKAGEVIVVIDKDQWDGELGEEVRSVLARDCEYLAQLEPMYSLANVAPGGFGDLFKIHRNIVIFKYDPSREKADISYLHDIWAAPQCVISILAKDPAQAKEAFAESSELIVSALEQAERDRVISSCIQYEEKDIAAALKPVFGGSPHFPYGYKLKKVTEDFAWVADEKQYSMQGVLIYKYPATSAENEFSKENIIERRNEILKNNVPGMVDGSYMTTSKAFDITVTYLGYKGRRFAQTRGMWDVENDFMGGPFVSHSFYSPDGKDIIVLDAFVYAPKFDKRQLLRQVESILYSWE